MKRDIKDINTPKQYDEIYFGERTNQVLASESILKLLYSMVKNNDKVLDVGCGLGRYFPAFVRGKIYGTELSERCIEKIKIDYPTAKIVQWFAGNKLPYKNNFFNLIWAGEFLEHISDPKQAIDEFYRVLAPGGKIVFMTPFGEHSRCDEHLWFFYREDIEKLFAEYNNAEIKLVGFFDGKEYDYLTPDNELPDEVKFQIIISKPL